MGVAPTHEHSKGWSSGDRRWSEQRVGGRPVSGGELSGNALNAHGVERDGREVDRGRSQPQPITVAVTLSLSANLSFRKRKKGNIDRLIGICCIIARAVHLCSFVRRTRQERTNIVRFQR